MAHCTSTPFTDLRALYDNKFAVLYKDELNDPAGQEQTRVKQTQQAQEIAGPLKDYCNQVKRQLEAQSGDRLSEKYKSKFPKNRPREQNVPTNNGTFFNSKPKINKQSKRINPAQ